MTIRLFEEFVSRAPYPMLKTTRLFEMSIPKALGVDNNKVVDGGIQ